MRSLFLLLTVGWASAFVPIHRPTKVEMTQLEMVSRRDALVGVISAAVLFPETVHAFSQQLDDNAFEPQQQATDGKWDLNSAFVGYVLCAIRIF
jgi:hypothetical protein